MKTAAIAAFLVAAICGSADAQSQFSPGKVQVQAVPANFQKLMLDAVNAERAKVNLTALCTNLKLQKAAQLHSEDQAKNNFMSHTGSTGSTMQSRVDAQVYKWNALGENVAAGQADVAAVMKSWMNSAGHKANILGNFKQFGTGYAYNAAGTYRHYWTQDFGTGRTESCDDATTDPVQTPAPTPAPTTTAPTPAPTPALTPAQTTTAPTPAPTTVAPTPAPTTEAPTPAPTTVAPTPAPTTEVPTPAPTTVAPTPAPTTVAPTPAPTTVAPTPAPTTVAPTPAPTTVAPTPAPTTPKPTPAPTTAAPTPNPADSIQKRMLDAVNAERAKNGLGPYCTNLKLQKAAQLHSEDQAKNNFMSHTGSNGSSMQTRIDAQAFKWNSIAENVAAGQVDVKAVVASWMTSPGHRANILGKYKFFGMGYMYNPSSSYKHYWTQNFGTGSKETCDDVQTIQSTTAPSPVVAPTPAPTTAGPTTQTQEVRAATDIQKAVLEAVNAERAKANLPALCLNKKLQQAAQLHSDDQAKNNFMSHTGSNGSTMQSRIKAQSYDYRALGENVAAGQVDVAAVMKSWMNSSGHKANILGNFKQLGVGYAYNAAGTYKHYWTQDFGTSPTDACDA